MARRRGQSGDVRIIKGRAYGRYYVDGVEERDRPSVPLGKCSKTEARRRLRKIIESRGINDIEGQIAAVTAPTFREESALWIMRKEKRVAEKTLEKWKAAVDVWLLPSIGDLRLNEVGNGALKRVVATMTAAKLKPATIRSYIQPLTMIVDECFDGEGNQRYPRKWNFDFAEVPVIKASQQHRPTITRAQIESLLVSDAELTERVLFAVLAGTGLRVGEGQALRDSDASPDGRVISVRRTMGRRGEKEPKTSAGHRDVDVPEPLASLLVKWKAGKQGLLFTTRSGRPKSQRNILRTLHRLVGDVGTHSFRRFRHEVLRCAGVPEDIISFWVGHAERGLNALYAQGTRTSTPDYLARRAEWCAKTGLGFELPVSISDQIGKLGEIDLAVSGRPVRT
jgi:integrase